MEKYELKINQLSDRLPFLKNEKFSPALSGTNYKVFLSKNFVIRFRDKAPDLLLREAQFLKKLNHPLIPKVLWVGTVNKSRVLIENRLPGDTLDLLWKKLNEKNKKAVIKDIINFLKYLRSQANNRVYSVKTGKQYLNFNDYLIEDFEKKLSKMKKVKLANKLLEKLTAIIFNPSYNNLLTENNPIILAHGDLIIHNLLSDGKRLTGVLDWEFALFGDKDYDIARLFYYQECAKAYHGKGIDKTFEADYMNKLTAAIKNSGLINNLIDFKNKYTYIRAIFFLNALFWAVCSINPQKNIKEIVALWSKKWARR